MDLRVYMIHEEGLVARKPRYEATLQAIHALTGGLPKITLVNQPSAGLLKPLMEKLQERADYSETGDAEFDRQRQILTAEHFSNLEKHKEAWKRIAASSLSSEKEVHLVIEDDSVLLQDSVAAFQEAMTAAAAGLMRDWDLVFLGLSDPAGDPKAPFSVVPVSREKMKVIPCKDCYLIRPSAARALLAYFTPTLRLRFGLRLQLSYKLWSDPGFLRVGYPTKRVFLDGSKLGLCPSTLHANNLLVLNKEYMDLFAYLARPSLTGEDVARIREIYRAVESLGSPDILHIYGVLMYKAERVSEAEEALGRAITEMTRQGGVLHARSDLLNNAINIYEKIQPDLEGLLALPSKYAVASA